MYNRMGKRMKFRPLHGVLKLAQYLDNDNNKLLCYIDLHAHSTLSNSFMFGNDHPEETIRNQITRFPLIISKLIPHFAYQTISAFSFYGYRPTEEYEDLESE